MIDSDREKQNFRKRHTNSRPLVRPAPSTLCSSLLSYILASTFQSFSTRSGRPKIGRHDNGDVQNLPLPTTLRIVPLPLLLLLLVGLLIVWITGILATTPLSNACTVTFADSSACSTVDDGITTNAFDGTCLERVDRRRLRLRKQG